MSRRGRSTKPVTTEAGATVTPATGQPAAQRVTAPACKSCRSEDTFIYHTAKPIRYVKCRGCGHSFSFAPPKPAAKAA